VDPVDDITGFRVYPNPARNFLIIEYEGAKVSTCSLLNMSGQTALRFSLDPGGSTRIDVSGLPPGIYLLRITGCPSCSARVVIC
jgi:hypothetical protein